MWEGSAMSDCCHMPTGLQKRRSRLVCRHCGREGQPVDRTTVEAVLTPESLSQVNGSAYAFCETPDCLVVYYAADGTAFKKNQVRVRVGFKETEDPIPVCYCFNVTERMIREEVAQTGRSTASARIRAEVQAGMCRCAVENPSGRCCLGEIRQAEQRAAAERTGRSQDLARSERKERAYGVSSQQSGQDRIDGSIRPLATETAMQLLSFAKSMLGEDSAQLDRKAATVRREVLTRYPQLGRAPTRHEIVSALQGSSADEIHTTVARLHKLDMLCLDSESQEIRVAYPYSNGPTRHLVRFPGWDDATPVYAPCAVDALGIPFMVRQDVSIASSCAHCAESVAITIEGGAIDTASPPTTVVWAGTTRTGHAADSVCPTINFFCAPDHAIAWRQQQRDATGHVLSLEEALYVGKGIFEDLLRPHPGTVSSASTAASLPETAKAAVTASTAGGLLTAFLASICCIGPVVFAALGVGVGATGFLADTAGVLKALLPYRPLFIGLTMIFLGISISLASRTPTVGEASCQACGPSSGGRSHRRFLWVIVGLAVALVLAPYWLEFVTG